MDNSYNNTLTKRRIIAISTSIFLLIIFWSVFSWISSHAYIKIDAQNSDKSEITYLLTNENGDETSLTTKDSSFKKLVRKGSYQVLVTQPKGSYFEINNVGGFLKTSNISVKFSPEKNREFVGNNPDPCMHYNQNILLSSACSEVDYSEIKIHLPASFNFPTITKNPAGSEYALNYAGAIELTGTTKLIVGGSPAYASESSSDVAVYRMFDLKQDLTLDKGVILKELVGTEKYGITPFGEGFLAYDNSFENVFYYANGGSEAKKISLKTISDEGYAPVSLSAHSNTIAIAYSDNVKGENTGQDSVDSKASSKPARGTTRVQLYTDGKTREMTFDGAPAYAQLCGKQYFCIVSGRTLNIYDISGEEPSLLITMAGVNKIEVDGDSLIAVKDQEVIGLDILTKKGSVQYSYGTYKQCGVRAVQAGGYILCVINQKNDRSALYINTSKDGSDNIDKKVATLIEDKNISNLSVYKQFLFVSPNLGDRVYNQAKKEYTFDPIVKQRVNSEILKLFGESGIDTNTYKLVNTLP